MKHRIVIVVLVLLSMGLNMNAQNVTGEAKKREKFPVTSVQSVIPANGLFLMQSSKVRKRYLPSSMTMVVKT